MSVGWKRIFVHPETKKIEKYILESSLKFKLCKLIPTETTWNAIADSENNTPKNWLNMSPCSVTAKASVNLSIIPNGTK